MRMSIFFTVGRNRCLQTVRPVRSAPSGFWWVSLALVAMPVFADRIFRYGVRGVGILMCATRVGAVMVALMLAAKTGVHDRTAFRPATSPVRRGRSFRVVFQPARLDQNLCLLTSE